MQPNEPNPNEPISGNPYPPPPPPLFEDPAPAATQSVPPPPSHQPGGLPSKEERTWAMFAHLSALLAGLIASTVGMPFLSFLAPLVIYLMKKDESAFIADQAREALNFNICVSIIMFALALFSLLIITMIITIPLMIILGLVALVLTVIAAIKANDGIAYRYPFNFRLVN